MSDGLVALQAQLRKAMSYESELNRAWPLITAALSAERQAGRLQGREEAAEAIRTAAAAQSSEGEYGYGALVALRRAVQLARGVPVEAAQETK